MLKYQITGDMVRAKMDELLEERRILLPTVMSPAEKGALYLYAYNILKEEMEKQKAEDEWERKALRLLKKEREEKQKAEDENYD